MLAASLYSKSYGQGARVAGGIAGLRDGVRIIPERWLKNLRGKEIYEPELKKLIDWRC